MDSLVVNFTLFSVLIALFSLTSFIWQKSKSGKKLPPSPWKLPIIGHLHHLRGALPHHALRKLSQKYGGLIHLQVGGISTVVVSSPRIAKEILKTQDLVFASRMEFMEGKLLWYNQTGIGFAPYDEFWKQMHRIYTRELLSTARVRSFRWIRQEEALNLIASVKDTAIGSSATPTPINLTTKLSECITTIVARAAFGNDGKDDLKAFLELFREALLYVSGFDFSEVFPSLRILHPLLSNKSRLMKIQAKLDRVLDRMIDHHLSRTDKPSTEDLIDALLRIKETGDLQIPLTKEHIKAVVMDIFAAGPDTTSLTLHWAFVEMIRHPEVMKKVQYEVRAALRGKEAIEEADVQELEYLNLVIKETLRLHPPGPLSIPRESREETEVDGYNIAAKTRVVVNLWAIGRDPEWWEDPESFKPERFEDSDIDFMGSHFQYIPFGAGRRMCSGISLALANMRLPLALLLYHFDWKLPNGINSWDVNMSEISGIAVPRTDNLFLQAELYDHSLDL